MRGRTHLLLSILSLLVIALPLWADLPPSAWLVILAGILVGSLAPDVDAADSAIFHLRMLPRELRGLLWLFGYLLRYLVYYPLSLLFWIVLSRNYRHEHRGLLHTPVGVTLATLLITAYAAVLSFLFLHSLSTGILLLSVAFWSGCILHLLQDSCTPSGISWGFPLGSARLQGTIRTGDHHDPRPVVYSLVLIGGIAFLYLWRGSTFLPTTVIALPLLIAAWFFFLVLAGTGRTST